MNVENQKAVDGMTAEVEGVKFVETVIARTPWGNKTAMLPEVKVEETEEQKTARVKLQEDNEEVLKTEKEKVDRWYENAFNYNENREFVISAQAMADEFNDTLRKEGKRKMTAWDAIKFRVRYALPAAACHSKGQKFHRGSGKRRQEYNVGSDGVWRKATN